MLDTLSHNNQGCFCSRSVRVTRLHTLHNFSLGSREINICVWYIFSQAHPVFKLYIVHQAGRIFHPWLKQTCTVTYTAVLQARDTARHCVNGQKVGLGLVRPQRAASLCFTLWKRPWIWSVNSLLKQRGRENRAGRRADYKKKREKES